MTLWLYAGLLAVLVVAHLVRGGGGVELQVHVPHQLPHRLQVAAVLAALLAVPARLSQVLACHACTTPAPCRAKAQVLCRILLHLLLHEVMILTESHWSHR